MTPLQIVLMTVSLALASINLLVLLSKPVRLLLFKSKTRLIEDAAEKEEMKETNRCVLRDRLTEIYYNNVETKKIKHYEYENVTKLYKQYKKLGGNSYIDRIYIEIEKEWDII